MTRIRFEWEGEVEVDADALGIVAANGITSDDSLEAQDGVMAIRLDPAKALGAWLSGLVFKEFYDTFGGGDHARIVAAPVVAKVMDSDSGPGGDE